MTLNTNLFREPTLRQVLDLSNADKLKMLVALLLGVKLKGPRKGGAIICVGQFLAN
jgi:hypothetical protein